MTVLRKKLLKRLVKDFGKHRRDGFTMSDAEWKAWLAELEGRHTTHCGWGPDKMPVEFCGCAVLDEDGNKRYFPAV